MSSEEDKPPAPPVRLTSNRGGGISGVVGIGDRGGDGGAQPPVDMRPLPKGMCHYITQSPFRKNNRFCLHAEPEDPDRKKKTLKSKIKGSKPSHGDSKPNISYPTNFEHTVHVGFDAVTGEFTVSEGRTRVCAFGQRFFCFLLLFCNVLIRASATHCAISFCPPSPFQKLVISCITRAHN